MLAKPPQRGRCKSRLAADVGEGRAARLARAFLHDAWAAAQAACVRARARGLAADAVLATTAPGSEYPCLDPEPACVPQPEGDLGRRMAGLLADALAIRSRALLLGTDTVALPDGHLDAAIDALADHDAVLGAHEDGGFWCLGGRASAVALRSPAWLDGLDWTRDATRAPTAERVRALRLSLAEAPAWFDVDRGDDLARLASVLGRTPPSGAKPPSCATPSPAPRTAAELARGPDDGLVSVVVPTWNEGDGLRAALDALARQPGPLEVVVADGGSTDGSLAACPPEVVRVRSARGRGTQLAAGARAATADVLLFLHCDGRLPDDGLAHVRASVAAGAEAGAFVTRTVADPELPNRLGPLLRLADLRSRITRHPYGDQALFCTRAGYLAAGGFAEIPLMEDLDLARRLAARGPLARLHTPVTVSGRRFQRHPLRSLVLMRTLPALWRLGVKPETLARLYERESREPRAQGPATSSW